MLGVKAIRRRLRRRALRLNGSRPEEEVFDRFAERFGPTLREGKPKESPEESQEETQQECQEGPREETWQERPRDASSQLPVPAVPVSPALEVLGLGAVASPQEINAAYKRMARTYHPDKVAGESAEIREYAEEKMKEINAAYSELKLRI